MGVAMKHFGAPPPFGKSEGAVHTVATSQRESDDNYRDVVALLAPRWRVICCRDGIQWILQKKEASHEAPWRGVKYFTTKAALIEACGSLNLLSEPNAEVSFPPKLVPRILLKLS